jgi:hypothetical protein
LEGSLPPFLVIGKVPEPVRNMGGEKFEFEGWNGFSEAGLKRVLDTRKMLVKIRPPIYGIRLTTLKKNYKFL